MDAPRISPDAVTTKAHRTPSPSIPWAGLFPLTAALWLGLACPCRAQRTQADDLWSIPDGSIAWLAADTRALGPALDDANQTLALSALRSLLESSWDIDGDAPALPSALLSASVLDGAPFRMCLLDLAAAPGRPDRLVRLEQLRAVLEVRAPAEGHERFIAAIRGALDQDRRGARRGVGTERALALAGDRRATAFAREGDPDWRQVAWLSTPNAFYLGLGAGSLDRWFAAPTRGAAAEWALHRKSIGERRGRTEPVVEAYIDLNALRIAAPEEVGLGRLGRLAAAWQVANARTVMFSVRIARPAAPKPGETPPPPGPPLLLLDASSSSRAEKPGTVHSIGLSEAAWPKDAAGLEKPTGGYAVLLKPEWEPWVTIGLDTSAALRPEGSVDPAAAQLRWMRGHRDALERMLGRAGEWCLITGPAGPETVALTATLKPAGPKDRLDADCREIFPTLDDRIKWDQTAKAWVFRITPDGRGPLAQFCWRTSADSVVGGWSLKSLGEAPKRPR
jgi:hypothetical protein